MPLVSLQEAMRLAGIEGWTLNESQKRYLIRSISDLKQRNGELWLRGSRERLKREYEIVLQELGPIIKPEKD